MAQTRGQQQLESVGYKVMRRWRGRWFDCIDPDGAECAVLKLGNASWHWFDKNIAATASGCNVESANRGTLGDAIGDDRDMRAYKQSLATSAVPKELQQYEGVYAAMLQVFND